FMLADTGDPNTTCITTENAGLVGGILTAQAQSISGSSTLSLTIDTADQCDARTSTCTIAFCGFRVGAWTLAGTLAADGFPVSTITGNVVIYLLGEAYIEVDLKAVYVDAGAYAIDARESYVPVTVHGLDALSTDQPTEESFILRYTASDRKGNAARVVTRQVAVVDPCGWPASACPGNGSTVICETCVDSSASASGYSCLCISGDEGVDEDWEGEAATPSLDKVSPSLTLDTGEGTPVTLSGVRVIVHCLYVNAPWIEPGYSASDNVDGDVTAQVTKYGTHALWDTSVATPADDPFIIEYDVTDTAGNRAGVERRRVYVIDPCEAEGEVVCSFVTGECSVNQICVNSTQAVDATSSSPPELALVGPELITVNEGDYYGPCGLSYPAGAVCDHGATATDSLDGDLADHITACETETETNLFKVRGLSGCPLDTRTPGLYNITFAAANSAGLRAAAVRQLLVMINCVSYEHRCSSLLECSVNGLCQSDLGGGGESAQPAENSAPNLTVVEAGATPQYVDVKRFYEWALCGYNVTSTVEFPCDPGVEAYDAEDGNLTSRVLACPSGCSNPAECEGLLSKVSRAASTHPPSPVSCEERQALLDLTLRRRRRRLHADASDPQGLQSLVTGLQDGYATLGESLSQLALTVGGGGGSASVWESQVMDTWAAALKSETTHQDNLLSSIEQAIENQDAILEAVELQNEALAATETAMAEAEAQQSALWVAASDLEDAAMQMVEVEEITSLAALSVDSSYKMARYLGANRLVGGMLLVAHRNSDVDVMEPQCTDRFERLRAPCMKSASGEKPEGARIYGMDMVFFERSELYDPDAVQDGELYYDTAPGSRQVRRSDQPYFPYPFVERPESGMTQGSYPVWIEAGLIANRALQLALLMDEGYYLDSACTGLTATAVTYQATLDLFTVQQMHFEWAKSGTIIAHYTAAYVRVPQLSSWHLVNILTMVWMVVMGTMLLLRVAQWSKETHAYFRFHGRLDRSVLATASAGRVYLWAFQALGAVLWKAFRDFADGLEVPMEYDILDDLYKPANFLMPSKQDDDTAIGTVSGDAGTPRWALPNDETGMKRYLSMLSDVQSLEQKRIGYWGFQAAVTLFLVIATLQTFSFHSRLNFVSEALWACSGELASFFVVLFIIQVQFAMAGHILYGEQYQEFSNAGTAIVNMFTFVASGDWALINVVFFPERKGLDYSAGEYIILYTFIMSNCFITLFTLVNMLMAILGDAQAKLKDDMKGLSKDLGGLYKSGSGGVHEAPSCFTEVISLINTRYPRK
ncbi:hypothetical protein CYMTET_36800, partial [Cymbomonas tetramitiformis]